MNGDRIEINWKFDRKAARRKFGYKREFLVLNCVNTYLY